MEDENVEEFLEEATGLENENVEAEAEGEPDEEGRPGWLSAVRSTGPGFTGVVSPPPMASGGGAAASMTFPGWPTGPVYPGPSHPATTTTMAAPKLKKRENVRLPSKTTRKVLVAFIEEEEGAEDRIIWAAHLQMEDISININVDPEDRDYMDLTLSLEDHYGNNKK